MTGVQTCALPIYHAQERRGRSMKGESKRSWRKGFDKARTAFACVLTDVLSGRRFHVVIPIEMPLVPKMGTYPRKLSRIDSSSHIITGILLFGPKIGRASCRERLCQYV